ncbi:unnamed protein product [Paramecium sonneborni]|uniref:Tetratricopeptide repeat protein n=1 Tax=Paramecium sonneborni TaxID=65129 RepID=A0A8S1RTJ0_9CILI|nr:unnamed protein product [Paramecium sonneborni]
MQRFQILVLLAMCNGSGETYQLQVGPKRIWLNLEFNGQMQRKFSQFNKLIEQFLCKVNAKYEEWSKYMENMNKQLVKLSECLTQQDYQYIKQNIQLVKEWYKYFNNQEENIKQNQIVTQLQIFIQNIEIELQQGILFGQQSMRNRIKKNKRKFQINQICRNSNRPMINSLNAKSIREKSIFCYIMYINIFRQLNQINQAKDQLQFHKQKRKIVTYLEIYWIIQIQNQGRIQIIFLCYALNQEQIYQEVMEQCEKVLREEPQILHGYYGKSISLANSNKNIEAIQCIEEAFKCKCSYCVGYIKKSQCLNKVMQYKEAIICLDKALEIDPNNAATQINKGIPLNLRIIDVNINGLKQYSDEIACLDRAIQLNPSYAITYNNKGVSLENLNKDHEALANYSNSLMINQTYAQAYKNKGNLLNSLLLS